MQELIPVLCGLALGAGLGALRPGIRLVVAVFHENSIATKAPLIVAADENAGRFLDYIALRGPPLVDSRIYHRCQLLQRSTSGTGSI